MSKQKFPCSDCGEMHPLSELERLIEDYRTDKYGNPYRYCRKCEEESWREMSKKALRKIYEEEDKEMRKELTVAELIERLKEFPQDLPVVTDHDESLTYISIGKGSVKLARMIRDTSIDDFGGDHKIINYYDENIPDNTEVVVAITPP